IWLHLCSSTRPPPGFILFPYTTLFRSGVNIASPFPVTFNQTLLAGGAVLQGTVRDASTNLPIGNAFLGYAGSNTFQWGPSTRSRSEEHTSELQSRGQLVCRPPLEKKNT